MTEEPSAAPNGGASDFRGPPPGRDSFFERSRRRESWDSARPSFDSPRRPSTAGGSGSGFSARVEDWTVPLPRDERLERCATAVNLSVRERDCRSCRVCV